MKRVHTKQECIIKHSAELTLPGAAQPAVAGDVMLAYARLTPLNGSMVRRQRRPNAMRASECLEGRQGQGAEGESVAKASLGTNEEKRA